MSSSGPPSLGRPPHSEPRSHRSSGTMRLSNSMADQESGDRASVASGVMDDRPNNWDFSDWRPSSMFDSSASRPMKKKANQESTRVEHKAEVSSSPSQRLSSARPAPNEGRGNKPVTPATFPRTQGVGLSLSGKRALENLRQELTFSDVDEAMDSVAAAAGRNNERPQQRRTERKVNPQPPREMERNETRATLRGAAAPPLRNPNLNLEDDDAGPDSNQIVGRLMQIRDYIKQSSTMIATLQNSTDPRSKEQLDKLSSLVAHLKDQEKGYLSLLQQILATREEDLYMRQNSTDQTNSRQESDSDVASELDIESNSSDENETDGNAHAEDSEAVGSNLRRPIIEDRLHRVDSELEELRAMRVGRRGNAANNVEVNGGGIAEEEEEGGLEGVNELLSRRTQLETYLADKSGELNALRQQQALLKKMLDQQEELQSLQQRRTEAERLLVEKRASDSNTRGAMSLAAAAAGASTSQQEESSSSDDDDNGNDDNKVDNSNLAPTVQEVRDLQQRLEYLKLMFSAKEAQSEANGDVAAEATASASVVVEQMLPPQRKQEAPAPPGGGSVPAEVQRLCEVTEEREQLQEKLAELQQKKEGMDALLQELHKLRSSQVLGNTDMDGASSVTSSQAQMNEGVVVTASASSTAREATDLLKAMDAHKKLQKLEEVKTRLGELRDLVQYYHGSAGRPDAGAAAAVAPDDVDDQSSLPEPTVNYDDPQPMEKNLRNWSNEGMDELLRRHPGGPPISQQRLGVLPTRKASGAGKRTTREVTETDQSDTTETASQMSSTIGAWSEDPEMVEKVQRLKAAKEKLRRLQELVAMVQQSPDMAHALPDDLADLAMGSESEDGDEAAEAGDDEGGVVMKDSPGAAVAAVSRANNVGTATEDAGGDEELYSERERFYAAKMAEQQQELENLMSERENLIQVQSELQRLHDALPSTLAAAAGEQLTEESMQRAADARNHSGSTALRKVPPGRPPPPRARSDDRPRPRSGPQEVTFQEPLETVMSNEELYDRMRQQRMLREELRERKKELEQFMKKDRPRRAYARNQQTDNQSDNISYSNKSYQDGASEDVTMATWGGSTIGNLESIDEGDGGRHNQRNEDMDDAYPSDGVIQVEEEEEAQEESDDRETYTIDDDYPSTQRGIAAAAAAAAVSRQQHPHETRDGPGQESRSSGAPFQDNSGQYTYNYWAPDSNQLLNNSRRESVPGGRKKSAQRKKRSVQSRGRTRENSQLQAMQEELKALKAQMQSMVQGSPLSPNSAGLQQQYSQLLQQQLINHCYQVLQMQQDLSERFSHLENNILQQDTSFRASGMGGSMSSLLRSPSAPFQHAPRPTTTGAPANQPRSSRPRNFSLDPQFPDSFAFLQDPNAYVARNGQNGEGSNLLAMSEERMGSDYISQNYQVPGITRLGSGGERQQYASPRQDARLQEVGPATIPIETIQARDSADVASSDNVPRLQLEEVCRPKQRKRSPKRPKSSPATNDNEHFQVIGQFRTGAAAQLANQKTATKSSPIPRKVYRPGLSGGISGAGYQETGSMSSVRSSVPGGDENLHSASTHQDMASMHAADNLRNDTGGEMNVFETLRETIYAEVATLISQNEKRPHFLIELFRELQLLSSDYLRQRALYAIQELVAKHLTDNTFGPENRKAWVPPSRGASTALGGQAAYENSAEGNELTPSESIMTSDDEDKGMGVLPMQGEEEDDAGSVNSNRFDYAENVATSSSLSTPSTSAQVHQGAWGEEHNPFAQESLGDTVIHLDQALKRMREYERKLAEVGGTDVSGASPANVRVKATVMNEPSDGRGGSSEGQGNDAQSDGSLSDVPISEKSSVAEELNYPRIDAQQLDGQIKAIMAELIPVLREHMADVCSPQLLQYIRRLVLSLTKHQHTGQQEFVRFFHNQLASILTDSLAKFDGRKMRECGEDMLVEISEILFNELAFFRLMQDLDDPKAKVKARLKQWRDQDSAMSQTSTETATTQEEPVYTRASLRTNLPHSSSSSTTSLSSEMSSDEDQQKPCRDASQQTSVAEQEQDQPSNSDREIEEVIEVDEDDLGKERDDEFAAEVNISEDGSFTSHPNNVKIELAPSETKPFTRIGSDEDDEGDDDEAMSNEDPSETAVSRDAEKERCDELSPQSSPRTPPSISPGADDGNPTGDVNKVTPDDVSPDGNTPDVQLDTQTEQETVVNGLGNDEGSSSDLTMDDLPVKLDSLSKDELAAQQSREEAANNLDSHAVLQCSDTTGEAELAGDPLQLPEPELQPESSPARQL